MLGRARLSRTCSRPLPSAVEDSVPVAASSSRPDSLVLLAQLSPARDSRGFQNVAVAKKPATCSKGSFPFPSPRSRRSVFTHLSGFLPGACPPLEAGRDADPKTLPRPDLMMDCFALGHMTNVTRQRCGLLSRCEARRHGYFLDTGPLSAWRFGSPAECASSSLAITPHPMTGLSLLEEGCRTALGLQIPGVLVPDPGGLKKKMVLCMGQRHMAKAWTRNVALVWSHRGGETRQRSRRWPRGR